MASQMIVLQIEISSIVKPSEHLEVDKKLRRHGFMIIVIDTLSFSTDYCNWNAKRYSFSSNAAATTTKTPFLMGIFLGLIGNKGGILWVISRIWCY